MRIKRLALCCMFAYLAGLNPNMNVNCMEVGGLSMKDSPQPQSRLSQWTHPNSIENLSGNSSPMEPGLSKHGTAVTDLILFSISKCYVEHRFNTVYVSVSYFLCFPQVLSLQVQTLVLQVNPLWMIPTTRIIWCRVVTLLPVHWWPQTAGARARMPMIRCPMGPTSAGHQVGNCWTWSYSALCWLIN